jgi:hypothetical protein
MDEIAVADRKLLSPIQKSSPVQLLYVLLQRGLRFLEDMK